MLQITYADAWRIAERKPGRIVTAEEARSRHDAGQTYAVLLGTPEAPEKIVTMALAAGTITVHFLDRDRRIGVQHIFAQRDGERIFKEQTSFFDYLDEDVAGERAVHWETTDYARDGSWSTTEHFSDTRPETRHGFLVDRASNWETIPTFGDYVRISRYDDRDV